VPETQVVHPVYVDPPHLNATKLLEAPRRGDCQTYCPHCATVQPPPPVLELDELEEEEDDEEDELLDEEDVTPPPVPERRIASRTKFGDLCQQVNYSTSKNMLNAHRYRSPEDPDAALMVMVLVPVTSVPDAANHIVSSQSHHINQAL